MVSTRRTAHIEPEPDIATAHDLSNTLRKKPVRRATAKKTQPEPEAKSKTTRSRKAAPTPDVDVADESTAEQSEPNVPEKPARKAGRPRKDATSGVAEEPAPAKPAKATRIMASRIGKSGLRVEKVLDVPAATEPKPTRRTRATATKTQPLSPKKVTQVTKAQTRNTKAASEKSATTKAATRTGATTRKRTVSDANADVPDLTPATEEDDDSVVLLSTPVKRASPVKRREAVESAVKSEASMSSAPTTPSDSPAPSFDRMNDEHEYRQRSDTASVSHASEDDEENQQKADVSEDELCGPKTPMKRSSLGAEARYLASVQKTIRRAEANVPMETPRSFAHRIDKVGTPQTQKPYTKPAVPASEIRPMTVARGGDRAFVFRDLRVAPRAIQEEDQASILLDDEAAILEHDTSESTADDCAPVSQASPTPAAQDVEFESTQGEYSEADDDESVQQATASESEADPDETVLVNDAEGDTIASPTEQATESFESEDTVLIMGAEDESLLESEDEDEGEVLASPGPGSPTPETLIWENIRQDMTIPVNFDDHMAGVRGLPQVETTERLSMVADFAPFPVNFDYHMAGARVLPDVEVTERRSIAVDFAPFPSVELDEALTAAGVQGGSVEASVVESPDEAELSAVLVVGRKSLDATVNLNDFIDMAALAEPTGIIELPEASMDSNAERIGAFSEDTVEELEVSTNETLDMVTSAFESAVQSPGDNDAVEPDGLPSAESATTQPDVPHYALPTLAFDARRKSLPALGLHTPAKAGTRPNTSDGASMPRILNTFGEPWWTRSRSGSTAATPQQSPVRERPSTANGSRSGGHASTPAQVCATLKERFPRLEPRHDYQEHAQTAAAPSRFRTPAHTPVKRPATVQKHAAPAVTPRASSLRPRPTTRTPRSGTKSSPVEGGIATPVESPSERYPRLKHRQDDQEHANTIAAPSRFCTPAKAPTRQPATAQKVVGTATTPSVSSIRPRADAAPRAPEPTTPSHVSSSPSLATTPAKTPSERRPRLPTKANYEELAKTVAAPARFRTPAHTPPKRPSTVQKPGSLRKVALKNSTPLVSRTPVKTPLKPPAMTPSQAPMTPHPTAPLKNVVAMVEIFTLEGSSASAPFVALLHRLGAKTAKAWSDRVTHVIFKDGSPTTLQRVRLHNKDIDESGAGNHIHCVNSRWVSDCDTEGKRVDESDEAYAVDVAEVPRGGKRRRKSMEPSALVNLGGNIVRDRKGSLGRSSLGRSPLKFDSPAKKWEVTVEISPGSDAEDMENRDDETSSPVTPAYLAAPDKLVQQTAPINRMRKLGLKAQDKAKNRRLTYFPSRA